MSGFATFIGKEFTEIARTWRLWVLPLIAVGMGLLSPVAAKLTPALVSSLTAGQSDVVIELPDPAFADAYLQWTKNYVQIVLLAAVISMAGMVSSERRTGTAALVLTKPVSRSGFVAAKVLSNQVLVAVSAAIGALVCWGGAEALFEGGDVAAFARSVGLWIALAAFFVSAMGLFSVLIDSTGGAAGAGLGLYLVVTLLSGWGPGRDYTPAGLLGAGDRLMLGEEAAVAWPLATSLVLAIALAVAAALAFRRREI